MQKCVLITAGNTSEPIDRVRSITNTASGKLGSIIADAFYEKGGNVVYVCGKNSAKPTSPTLQTITIEGVTDLERTVRELAEQYTFDCIVHSMAVSDYTVKGILTYEELSEAILNSKSPVLNTKTGKLSSDLSNPVILLERAPKIIHEFRQLQPQALLVGFKLLVGVTEEELYKAGINIMKKNGCDLVCANDLNNINQDRHEAILISTDGQYKKLSTKAEIAAAIADKVFNLYAAEAADGGFK